MFPCDGYLQLAKKLAVVNNESCMRSAVSRAYYASLHKSIKLAEDNGATFLCKGKPEIHSEVLNYFRYRDITKFYLSGVERKLSRLRENRNKCDYKDNINNIKDVALNAIMDAEDIFNVR